MEQRMNIITLGVKNLKESINLYEKKFKWKKLKNSNDFIVFFQLNGIQLALYQKDDLAADAGVPAKGTGFKSFTLAYNARSEKEVDELIAELEKKEVAIVKKPQKVFWGGYSSYIEDPDGNLWEIAYNPFLKLDEKGNVL